MMSLGVHRGVILCARHVLLNNTLNLLHLLDKCLYLFLSAGEAVPFK